MALFRYLNRNDNKIDLNIMLLFKTKGVDIFTKYGKRDLIKERLVIKNSFGR